MTSPGIIVADALPDIRYWLRNQPDLNLIHNGRVFFRIPTNQTDWPLLRIYRSGGTIIDTGGGDGQTAVVNVSIEVWSNGPPQIANFSQFGVVRRLARTLESVLWTMPANTLLNPASTTIALDARATNTIDSPDPDSGWPWIVVDTRWQIKGL